MVAAAAMQFRRYVTADRWPVAVFRESVSAESAKPKLLDRVRHAIRARHYSRRTEKAYVHWIKRYIFFHGKRHPAEMGAAEVTAFLTALAVRERVAASTQNQALNALLFLYREILGVALPWLDDLVRAKRPQHLPTVLTRDEVRAVLEYLDGVPRLTVLLLYGAGLRLLECCRLRIKDIDFARKQITIRDGKGGKDRMTMLPGVATAGLAKHIDRVRALHQRDLRRGAGWVELPWALARKYPTRGASGPGNGCSPRRATMSTGARPSVAVITCASPSFAGQIWRVQHRWTPALRCTHRSVHRVTWFKIDWVGRIDEGVPTVTAR
jgi:integrase